VATPSDTRVEPPETSDPPRSGGLLERGIGAVMWGSLGAVVRIALQVVSQIILARLLGPQTYGVFAISLTIVLFASLFADLGLAYGLIQRARVDDADIRFVFTCQMLLGLATTLLLVALAAPIAGLFGDTTLTPVIQTLALGCLLGSFGATAGMLMRRALDFKTLNVAMVISYAVGFVGIGIPMALFGWGVWALVAANLVQIGVAAVITYWGIRHSVRPLVYHADAKAILGFGTTVLATNLLNWVMMSLDRLVIGVTMQTTAAGLYATMSNLMFAPILTLISVLQSALYATSARAQEDTERLRTALRSVIGAVTLFLGPIFFAIGMSAETLILALYGEKWAGGGAVLRPMAFAIPAFLLMGMAIPTLWASQRTTWEFRLQLPLAVVWAIGLYAIGSAGSIVLLSWMVCAWFYLRASVILTAAFYALDLRFSDFARPVWPGVVVTALVATVAWLVDQALVAAGWNPLMISLAIVPACAVGLAFGIGVIRKFLSAELHQLLAGMLGWVPQSCGQGAMKRILGLPA
jgi:lipopolysaccharide exporter